MKLMVEPTPRAQLILEAPERLIKNALRQKTYFTTGNIVCSWQLTCIPYREV